MRFRRVCIFGLCFWITAVHGQPSRSQAAFENEKHKCSSQKLIDVARRYGQEMGNWGVALHQLDVCIQDPQKADMVASGLEYTLNHLKNPEDLTAQIDAITDPEIRDMARFVYKRFRRAHAVPDLLSSEATASLLSIHSDLKKAVSEKGTSYVARERLESINAAIRGVEIGRMQRQSEREKFDRQFACLLKRSEITDEDRRRLLELRRCTERMQAVMPRLMVHDYLGGLMPEDPCRQAATGAYGLKENALHPRFREQVSGLLANCTKLGL